MISITLLSRTTFRKETPHDIINHDLSRRPITLEQGLVLWNQNVSISLYNRPDKFMLYF